MITSRHSFHHRQGGWNVASPDHAAHADTVNETLVAEGWAAAARGLADTWLGLAADAKAEGG